MESTSSFSLRRYLSSTYCFLTVAGLLIVAVGCGGGGSSTANSTPVPSPPPAPALVISTVSNSSPLPLTPLQLTVSGLDSTKPLAIQFTSTSGFSYTEPPIRIAPGNAVVVAAVPLYTDPNTKVIGPGSVSLIISQSTTTSNSMPIAIQDLPSVSSYGTQLGDISHAMLVFQAMQIGRRLNAYQAFQGAKGNTVDTSQAQTNLTALLGKTIAARRDVDRVSLNNTTVINAATYNDGTGLQFDASSLDMMDRVQAIFLSQTFGSLAFAPGGGSAGIPAVFAPPAVGYQQRRNSLRIDVGGRMLAHHKARNNASQLTTMQQIVLALQALNASGQIPLSTIEAIKGQNLLDEVSAVSAATGAVGGLANTTFGAWARVVSTVNTVVHCWVDDGMWAYAKATGNQQVADLIAQDMANIPATQLYGSLKNLVLAPIFVEGNIVVDLGSTVFDLALQGIQYYGIATNGTSTSESDNQTSQQVVQSDSSVFVSPTQGLAQINGTATITSTVGIEAPLSGIELSPAPGGGPMFGLADPSGNYSLFVPLGDSTFNYSASQFSVFDPITQNVLTSETVDLSTAGTTAPIQLPAMQGQCNDPDFPDNDDPDGE